MKEEKKSLEEYKSIISELLENISRHKMRIFSLQESNNKLEQSADELKSSLNVKDRTIVELEIRLKQRETEVIEKDRRIAEQDERLIKLDQQVKDTLHYIEIINSGILVQIAGKYQGVVNKILPWGTTGRGGYELVLSAVRITLKEGPAATLKKMGAWHRDRLSRKADEFDPNISPRIAEQLKFKSNANPTVSIVIPNYCNWKYTLNCLKSVCANTEDGYEIIIVDNASTDDSVKVLSKIRNINLIKNTENLRFIGACNMGAAASRSNYVLFLNNDTLVTKKWLSSLIKVIQASDVGAVGSKLIYPDGKLQEAGTIIWKDGHGWNYGRGDDPGKPEYNFLREVDYCSAASLMVKKDVFNKVGGFDTIFNPGYYEDTDLCFSIRQAGYKIIYQPESVVIHFEGITNGTDTKSGITGIKKFQEVNRPKFVEKWNKVLQQDHYQYDEIKLFFARTRKKGKRILVLDQWMPKHDKDAGSLRMSYILRILCELGYNVTFIGDDLLQTEPYCSTLQEQGIETIYKPYVNSVQDYIKANSKYFNVFWLSRPLSIKYVDIIRSINPEARLVYDTVDLHFLRLERQAEIDHDDELPKLSANFKKQELYLMQNTDKTVVVSEYEKQLLRTEIPSADVNIVSIIHDICPPVKTFRERKEILFVGGFDHAPNIDAVNYLVKDIFPLVKKELPGVKIYLVGNIPSPHPAEQVRDLQSGDVIVTGYVKELRNYFENCRVFVAPLRFGAGVKGKITHSMSHGLPVVTTDIGAESTHMIDGENGLIANDAHAFADKIVKLYTDEQLWKTVSLNSVKTIEEYFSFDVAKEKVHKIIEGLFSL